MANFVNMLLCKNIKASLLAPIWVVAGLLLFLLLGASAPGQSLVISYSKDQTTLQAAQAESIPLTLTASEPTKHAGIIHESENLSLPLLVLLLAFLFPVFLLRQKSFYLSPVYKIFNFYSILPNGP